MPTSFFWFHQSFRRVSKVFQEPVENTCSFALDTGDYWLSEVDECRREDRGEVRYTNVPEKEKFSLTVCSPTTTNYK